MPEYRGRITIDGKGVFDYVLTQAQDGGVQIASSIPPQASATGQVVSVLLLSHEMKSGVSAATRKDGTPNKRAGERWEKHSFRGSDNRNYQTFDEKKVAQLTPKVGVGTPVKMIVEANAFKSWDILSVESV